MPDLSQTDPPRALCAVALACAEERSHTNPKSWLPARGGRVPVAVPRAEMEKNRETPKRKPTHRRNCETQNPRPAPRAQTKDDTEHVSRHSYARTERDWTQRCSVGSYQYNTKRTKHERKVPHIRSAHRGIVSAASRRKLQHIELCLSLTSGLLAATHAAARLRAHLLQVAHKCPVPTILVCSVRMRHLLPCTTCDLYVACDSVSVPCKRTSRLRCVSHRSQ